MNATLIYELSHWKADFLILSFFFVSFKNCYVMHVRDHLYVMRLAALLYSRDSSLSQQELLIFKNTTFFFLLHTNIEHENTSTE